jgi:hypothetical protein
MYTSPYILYTIQYRPTEYVGYPGKTGYGLTHFGSTDSKMKMPHEEPFAVKPLLEPSRVSQKCFPRKAAPGEGHGGAT